MSKHTPGPWKLAPKGYLSTCPVTDCGCLGRAIMTAYGDGVVVAGTNCNDDREVNARLIAAAPDLLAALKEAEWLGAPVGGQSTCPVCRHGRREGHQEGCPLRDAIAKAEEGS